MDLGGAVERLDGRFRPAAFDEHDGWDTVFGPGDRGALPARARAPFAATFDGDNGAASESVKEIGGGRRA